MDYSLMLAALSSLFWVGSAFEPMVYWAIHPGQRYGLASIEITVDFEACDAICAHYGKSLPCHAFNFRESDGTCQLVYEGGGQLVPAEGFHAFLKFSCLADDSSMEEIVIQWVNWNEVDQFGQEGTLQALERFHQRNSQAQDILYMPCDTCVVYDEVEAGRTCPVSSFRMIRRGTKRGASGGETGIGRADAGDGIDRVNGVVVGNAMERSTGRARAIRDTATKKTEGTSRAPAVGQKMGPTGTTAKGTTRATTRGTTRATTRGTTRPTTRGTTRATTKKPTGGNAGGGNGNNQGSILDAIVAAAASGVLAEKMASKAEKISEELSRLVESHPEDEALIISDYVRIILGVAADAINEGTIEGLPRATTRESARATTRGTTRATTRVAARGTTKKPTGSNTGGGKGNNNGSILDAFAAAAASGDQTEQIASNFGVISSQVARLAGSIPEDFMSGVSDFAGDILGAAADGTDGGSSERARQACFLFLSFSIGLNFLQHLLFLCV